MRVEERKFGNVEKVRDPDTGDYRSVRVIDYSVIATRTVIVVHASRWADEFEYTRVGTVDETLCAREVAEASAMARRNAKKQAIMKAVNLMAGKNEVAEMAQSNAVLFGATAGKAHHKDRIIALRQEHGWTPKSNCCWHNSSPSRCTSRIGSAS